VLPGVVAVELLIAGNQAAAVYIGRCAAYQEGFEFELRVIASGSDPSVELDPSLNGVYHRPGRPPGSSYEEMLRFGVEFSDGRKATNVGGRHPLSDDEPTEPVLQGQGGGGGGLRWRQDFWMWPLPPPGPLSFVCEWPAAGIPLTRAQVDGQALIDAAARAQQLFPSQDDDEFGWNATSGIFQIVRQADESPPAPK
jgi:hypothetical protein